MAMFWAMEEANTPRGWDDEEELDYTVVSQRQQAMQLQSRSVSPDRDKSTGALPGLSQAHIYPVYSLGGGGVSVVNHFLCNVDVYMLYCC